MNNKIMKWIGYASIIPWWIALTLMIIPCIIVVLIVISVLTKNWNWAALIREASASPYRVMTLPHRIREMDEADREYIDRVMAAFEHRWSVGLRHEQVNWKRDGF